MRLGRPRYQTAAAVTSVSASMAITDGVVNRLHPVDRVVCHGGESAQARADGEEQPGTARPRGAQQIAPAAAPHEEPDRQCPQVQDGEDLPGAAHQSQDDAERQASDKQDQGRPGAPPSAGRVAPVEAPAAPGGTAVRRGPGRAGTSCYL